MLSKINFVLLNGFFQFLYWTFLASFLFILFVVEICLPNNYNKRHQFKKIINELKDISKSISLFASILTCSYKIKYSNDVIYSDIDKILEDVKPELKGFGVSGFFKGEYQVCFFEEEDAVMFRLIT